MTPNNIWHYIAQWFCYKILFRLPWRCGVKVWAHISGGGKTIYGLRRLITSDQSTLTLCIFVCKVYLIFTIQDKIDLKEFKTKYNAFWAYIWHNQHALHPRAALCRQRNMYVFWFVYFLYKSHLISFLGLIFMYPLHAHINYEWALTWIKNLTISYPAQTCSNDG